MHAAARSSFNSDINVTPLVDVCLVLLIIFMVVTPIMVTKVPVSLPSASTADPLSKQPLQVTLKADGSAWVGDSIVRIDEIAGILQRERSGADRPVVIQADKSLSYGAVVNVLDLCRTAGFSNVGLAAQKRE